MKRSMKRKAFTIIEMTIVIAVIAILASVMIPTISGMIEKAYVSTDTQFAASLNIQLALWEVDNGDIENESDLQLAINEYYNDSNPGYYEKLTPKSGKYGHHYWYDVTNQQVILATYEEIGGSAVALTAGEENDFAVGNARTIQTSKGFYFLMDQGGSEIADLMIKLRDVSDNVQYSGVITSLEALEDDAALADILAAQLKTSALANTQGLFIAQAGVTNVYVPAYEIAVTLGNSDASASDLTNVQHINLPAYISIPSWALQNFNSGRGASDDGLYSNHATIYTNVAESELENYFGLNATNCILERPDGTRYLVDGEGIWRLPERTKVGEPEYTQALTFDIDVADTSASVATKKDGVLYVAYNCGTVTLKLSNIAPVNMTGATWTGNPTSDPDNNTATYTIAENAEDFTITASLPGGTESIEVRIVKVDTVYLSTTDIEKVGLTSSPSDSATADDEYPDLDIPLSYKNTSRGSWTLVPKIVLNYPDCGLTITGTFNIEFVNDTDEGKLAYSDKNVLSVGSGVSSNHDVAVKFTCNGKSSPIYTFKLTDESDAGFTKSDNVTTTEGYGITYTVGKTDGIPLSVLFKTDGYTSGTIYVDVCDTNGDQLQDTQTFTSLSDKLTLSTDAGEQVKIKIGIGGAQYGGLTVSVVNGKNVTSATGWTNVTGTSAATDAGLVLHTDLTNFADGTGMITVKNATVYGNLHKISWDDGTYNVYKSADNAIITLNNGAVDNLIIDGPNYSTTSTYSNGSTTGVYVFGVYANGTATITNSYISGFMSPVGAKKASSTVNLTSTVLKGGAMGNIYVNESGITLNITDCTMIRNFEGSLAAPGIYLDEKSTSTTITMTGTAQHTFATEEQAKTLPGISSFGGLAGSLVDLVNSSVGTHKIGTTTYVHMGVLMHASATVNGWSNNSTYTINGETYKYTEQTVSLFGSTAGAKACVVFGESSYEECSVCKESSHGWFSSCTGTIETKWTDNCTLCNGSSGQHTLSPSWGSSAAQYLAHRQAQQ